MTKNMATGQIYINLSTPIVQHLNENIAMVKSMLALYAATGWRVWLRKTEATLQYINKTFKNKQENGFIAASE